jgi:hypothetical protein
MISFTSLLDLGRAFARPLFLRNAFVAPAKAATEARSIQQTPQSLLFPLFAVFPAAFAAFRLPLCAFTA